jgi:hypothetical protein
LRISLVRVCVADFDIARIGNKEKERLTEIRYVRIGLEWIRP